MKNEDFIKDMLITAVILILVAIIMYLLILEAYKLYYLWLT
jgi:hypothetical protein